MMSPTYISWIILWLGFGIAATFCGIQVWYPAGCSSSSSSGGAGSGSSPTTTTTSTPGDVEKANKSKQLSVREEAEGTSSGETTRQLFYKLLWAALLSRFILLPIQIWIDQEWWTFLAETFPDMTFASAWALLVSFFCHLVGTAAGRTSTTTDTLVMQSIAYVMYGALMITYIWNDAAVLLLYALLCVIYAALFFTLLYVGPKLLSLLKPSLMKRSGLAFRLVSCCLLMALVFAARTVGLARKVLVGGFLLKNEQQAWWYTYGILELFPAISLLFMMMQQQGSGSNQNSRRGSRSPSAAMGSTPPSPSTTTTTRTTTSNTPPKKSKSSNSNNAAATTTTTTSSDVNMMRRAHSERPASKRSQQQQPRAAVVVGETTALLKPIATTATATTTTTQQQQQAQQQHVYGATTPHQHTDGGTL